MTDRFYPLGMEAEEDSWKTTYEVMNEMRSFARSAYPPGTAIHLPGARDHFGYSTPGPIAHRLAKSELALTEDIGVSNPREHHAITRIQEPDDRRIFETHDVSEMLKSYNSPVATMSLSPQNKSMSKSLSLPAIERRTIPPRLADPNPIVNKLEDDHFSYFVPKGLQREHKDKLNTSTLSKLKKENRISFPFSGEGTGFRSQGANTDWWPAGSNKNAPTSYRMAYSKPGFFRNNSPLLHAANASAASMDLQ
eukprot:CAMPEP_0197647052 /NCGR_PEP_ID=MMETSP1338-20131121/24043_1 /TAXON_ID=43686 ORGANISM="Pelagodinium beii, Strain RCC1491" /NCGR_SAMPLE_ID=MMETSP1338 /ASSEMBLY_ACC=CAM_ASM_000754 /LENGTH=250 /DNA_ID=CAMNT_0043220753 /DNA_START=73 /DNA_END=825 /DNA_ORIENTATION=+